MSETHSLVEVCILRETMVMVKFMTWHKIHACEVSWYAILRGDSPSGTVRMCSFCISSIVPIVTVLSVASARLKQFHHVNIPDTAVIPTLFQQLPYDFQYVPVRVSFCIQRTHVIHFFQVHI